MATGAPDSGEWSCHLLSALPTPAPLLVPGMMKVLGFLSPLGLSLPFPLERSLAPRSAAFHCSPGPFPAFLRLLFLLVLASLTPPRAWRPSIPWPHLTVSAALSLPIELGPPHPLALRGWLPWHGHHESPHSPLIVFPDDGPCPPHRNACLPFPAGSTRRGVWSTQACAGLGLSLSFLK